MQKKKKTDSKSYYKTTVPKCMAGTTQSFNAVSCKIQNWETFHCGSDLFFRKEYFLQ